MKLIKRLIFVATLQAATLSVAQQTPAPKQSQPIAIINGTAHLGNGDVIKNSLIIFKDGMLETVADATTIKVDLSGMKVINAAEKHIYPGFIIPNSTLGLVEIDAVKATDDEDEIGNLNPHIRSLIAYNAESRIVESMRPNGVLLGQITPRGGRISGTSSIVQFDAWNWEDAAIKVDDGIHLNWPQSFTRGRQWMGEPRGLKVNDKYLEQVNELSNFLTESKAYDKGNKLVKHLPFEATHGLFDGSKKLYVHVNDAKGIIDAISFKNANHIKAMVIVGGYEAHLVGDLLRQHHIPVLLKRIHSTPVREDDAYDLPFKIAKQLIDQGVLVSLENSGDMERMNARNLPFLAGTTAAYGLSKAQALQLITLNAAKILGIDDRYGSLEPGKSATLFISEGDALDMRTNRLEKAYIDGRELSLETHQTELWKRYTDKYKNSKQ